MIVKVAFIVKDCVVVRVAAPPPAGEAAVVGRARAGRRPRAARPRPAPRAPAARPRAPLAVSWPTATGPTGHVARIFGIKEFRMNLRMKRAG